LNSALCVSKENC